MRGVLLVLLAAVLWGMIGPVARFAFADGITPLEVAFWRAAIGGALFALHAAITKRLKIQPRDAPAVVVFGLLSVSLLYGAYQLAVLQGGAALASVLLYTAPAWVALFTWLLGWERIDRRTWGALALTVVGVGAIAQGSGEVRLGAGALFWGLLSGLTYALYFLFGKRYLGRYPPQTLLAWAQLVGALGLWPVVEFHHKGPRAWAVLVALAAVSTYGSYLAYYLGLKRLEATRAAVIATFEPVVAGIFAFLWWGETFRPLGYVGAGLVLAAVLLTVQPKASAAAQNAEALE